VYSGERSTLFGSEANVLADTLRRLDTSTLTPIEALNKLEELKKGVTPPKKKQNGLPWPRHKESKKLKV
jgi:hypothetical protein